MHIYTYIHVLIYIYIYMYIYIDIDIDIDIYNICLKHKKFSWGVSVLLNIGHHGWSTKNIF